MIRSPNLSFIEAIRTQLIPLLSEGTWEEIERVHEKLDVDWRPDLDPGWGKPKYARKVLDELSADEVRSLAQRCLEYFPEESTRNLQNCLWNIEAKGEHRISRVTRQELADSFDGRRMSPRESPSKFLSRFVDITIVRDISATVSYDESNILISADTRLNFAQFFEIPSDNGQYEQIYHRDFLERYGFFDWPDKRIFHFLEQLVDPTIRKGDDQAEWVILINRIIRSDGFSLVEDQQQSGHPIFKVRVRSGISQSPKNLIFASTGPKPEIGFRDAVSNEIVILKNEEFCLLFDERLPKGGLFWCDLVSWFGRKNNNFKNERDIRTALGERLKESIGSPPERRFFAEYFRQFRPRFGENLPALIPQVYLHYDPITVKELYRRGEKKRFGVQRMDFLLLLPDRTRIVIEIDGKQHYSREISEGQWEPSPQAYSKTTASDRELRLAGYDVYRFGGYELSERRRAKKTVSEFFRKLFTKHKIYPPAVGDE